MCSIKSLDQAGAREQASKHHASKFSAVVSAAMSAWVPAVDSSPNFFYCEWFTMAT